MPTQHGQAAASISTEAVQILRRHTGRGPTKARTLMDDQCVAIVLEDTLTTSERTLAENGEGELVLGTRHSLQRAMRDDLTSMVETLTGRKVRAFMSDNHIDPDTGVEVFLLEPQP
jgi:uncharacterized protein YbcI